jgi:transcriptional regulator with XRE-family HTH domain
MCHVFLNMRPSPLKHTVAILRTMIGLTQKELAVLVGRSTRTIQAIELEQLPLSEELALRMAEETGVDEGWLLKNDLNEKPGRRMELISLRNERGPYTKEDFEWARAYRESPAATEKQLEATLKPGPKKGEKTISFTLPEMKAAIKAAQPIMMEAMDRKLLRAMVHLLRETTTEPTALLMRWKLRRLMEELAKERDVEFPWPGLSEGDRPAKPPKTKGIKRSQNAL